MHQYTISSHQIFEPKAQQDHSLSVLLGNMKESLKHSTVSDIVTIWTGFSRNKLTNSLEYNSSSTANKSSASQEISHIFCNPEVLTRTHHFSLSWSISAQSVSSHPVCFDVILPFTFTFYKWSPLFRLCHQNSVWISHLPTCVVYRISNSILTHLLKKCYTNAWTDPREVKVNFDMCMN
jgi:hypothetical protein